MESRNLDKFQREAMNIGVKFTKDLVKARRDYNSPPSATYLKVHGGAGAGKTTVIDILAKWCHSLLSKEGDDTDCLYIVKTAFTGTAASKVEGQTLHTSFGFNFDNKHYSLSDKSRDEKRIMFRNLTIIIIDEVSMGQLIDVIRTREMEVDKLVVKLNDKKVGHANRRKFQGLAMKYLEAVIIERATIQFNSQLN